MAARRKNVVGVNVRKRRVAAGLSQDALAARLQAAGWDLSRAGLSKVEAGLRLVIDAEVMVLSRVLRVAPEALFEGASSRVILSVARQGQGG